MTSFEMRFVALRTKDVIAPTGTLVLAPACPSAMRAVRNTCGQRKTCWQSAYYL